MIILFDERAFFNVVGSLLQNPELLISGEYQLDLDDFPEEKRFYKIVYAAIHTLFNTDRKTINILDIDTYLSKYQSQYEIFKINNGIEYLQSAKKLANPDAYNESCLTLKKFSLLRRLKKENFYIDEIYDPKDEQKIKVFSKMNIDDILNHFERKILNLESIFASSNDGIQIAEGLDELLNDFEENPEMGVDCGINALNYFTYGLRKKYYLFGAKSGEGKTRFKAYLAIQVAVKQKIPSLFISTELESDEIQTIILSGLSGVPERHILLNQYSPGEKEKIQKAKQILKESPLYLVVLSDFTIEDVERTIKKYILAKDIEYVFFDYIKPSLSIIGSINKKTGGGLREDQILYLMSERLKALNTKYGVGIISSVQLNEDYSIAGAKAIIRPTDVYCQFIQVSQEEKDKLQLELLNPEWNRQNYVHMKLHCTKNRRGEKFFTVYLIVNHGTLDIIETMVMKNGEIYEVPKVKFE